MQKQKQKRNKIKKGKASTNHMNMSGRNTRFSEPDMKKPGKEKPKNAREQKTVHQNTWVWLNYLLTI